jgi:hypothetical protein
MITYLSGEQTMVGDVVSYNMPYPSQSQVQVSCDAGCQHWLTQGAILEIVAADPSGYPLDAQLVGTATNHRFSRCSASVFSLVRRASTYNNNLTTGGSSPGGVLQAAAPMSQAQHDIVAAAWEMRHGKPLPKQKGSGVCVCEIARLMADGCRCGATDRYVPGGFA